jgi:hypothetical protein
LPPAFVLAAGVLAFVDLLFFAFAAGLAVAVFVECFCAAGFSPSTLLTTIADDDDFFTAAVWIAR